MHDASGKPDMRDVLRDYETAMRAITGQIKQDPAKPPTKDNLNQEVLAAVVRPYPRLVAGTPTGAAKRSTSCERTSPRSRIKRPKPDRW